MNKDRPERELSLPSRRQLLLRGGCGFGALALTHLLHTDGVWAGSTPPPSQRTAHHPATARSVIFLFMEGGPSHLDTFDPKPKLNELAGQKLPESFGPIITAMGEAGSPLLASKRKWKQHGQSGLWVSDWLPHTAGCADDLCVIRSCWADGLNHVGSVGQMNTGSVQAGRPSLGSWIHYGLGSENLDLPNFVVLLDNPAMPSGGARNWGTGFMPAVYQGVQFRDGDEPIPNLHAPKGFSPQRQQRKLQLLDALNRQHASQRLDDGELDARLRSYELAFRMQASAPQAVDLASESKAMQEMYGLTDASTQSMGRCCLMARRLVERGVRFVQIYCGSGSRWDAHSDIEGNHGKLCKASDKPVAALIQDLKQRGLLDQTLVIWGGEFGRTPMSEKKNGRDHNPYGFTMWLAGGGVRGGQVIGSTDDLGLRAIEDRTHVHDLHATILHTLGLSHRRLTFPHNGRRETPTINEGEVVHKVFG